MESWITDKQIKILMKKQFLLASHGGVGSEYLTKLLNIQYPNVKVNGRPLKNCIVHYPYPPKGLKKLLYVYGDIYNSILSQVPRHYDNAAKLINNRKYPFFHKLDDLFDENDKGNLDPFNIEKHILAYMNIKRGYPIILLKYGFKKNLIKILKKITKNPLFDRYEFKSRKNSIENNNKKDKLIKIYRKLDIIVKNSPDLIIRFPNNNHTISQKDVIKYEVKKGFSKNRIKHFKNINGYTIFNERGIKPHSYGRLCIIKDGNRIHKTFTDYNIKINCMCGGVEDPRYFTFDNKTYVLMNGLDNKKHRNMYLYNVEDDIFCKLYINNFDISKIKNQKNWTPYIHLNELYLIYSFNQLCVLKVIDINKGECHCIKGNPFKYNNKFKYFGSTQLIQWNYPYYIGFVHVRKPWLSCPIVYNVEKMEVTRYGNIFALKSAINKQWRKGTIVQFPYDLEIKNGKFILSIEFEDQCPTEVHLDYIKCCKVFS
jgi:hypothetical protein